MATPVMERLYTLMCVMFLAITTIHVTKATFLSEQQLTNIKHQLENDEASRNFIYLDSVKKPTMGIGHLITDHDPESKFKLHTPVSSERCNQLFALDFDIAIARIVELFPDCQKWPGEVKEIMVNMMFNLGYRLKGFKKLIDAINKRDWKRAADEMKDSKWYGQVKGRAERLVARMRNSCVIVSAFIIFCSS